MTVMAGLLCCLFCLTGCCRVPHFFISCIIQVEPKSLFSLTIEKSGHRLLCLFRFFLFMLWRSMFMRYRIIPILQETECKRKVFSGKISLLISTKFYKGWRQQKKGERKTFHPYCFVSDKAEPAMLTEYDVQRSAAWFSAILCLLPANQRSDSRR